MSAEADVTVIIKQEDHEESESSNSTNTSTSTSTITNRCQNVNTFDLKKDMDEDSHRVLPMDTNVLSSVHYVQVQGESATPPNPKIELNAHFPSFISLRSALDKYQKENHVQLVVKDSKLLSAESTRKVIQKVYHLVNQSLMYHSITYYCKCHGALKQKPGSRIKNIGAKRLNCPVYLRFKLSTDLQSLVLFDWYQIHNHPTDPNTFQLSPRQQVYRLTRMRRGEPDPAQSNPDLRPPATPKPPSVDVHTLITSAIKDVNSVSSLTETDYQYQPPPKKVCSGTKQAVIETSPDQLPAKDQHAEVENNEDTESEKGDDGADDTETGNGDDEEGDDNINNDDDDGDEEEEEEDIFMYKDISNSPLDPESSCSDSDEEEFRKNRHLLSYPIRLIGSAVQCSPELISMTKQLIETQKENLHIERRKLLLETKQLELQNAKLSLEVRDLEKNIAAASGTDNATTFYLQG